MNELGLGITLKKLSKQEGEWVLEVQRMVPLGNSLHQPTPQKISGQALIGRHLRSVPELVDMADVTESLMTDEEAQDSYEIWQGNWVDEEMMNVLAPSRKHGQSLGATTGSSKGSVSRRELSKLMRMNDAMAKRIALLEASNHSGLVQQFDQMSRVLTSLSSRLKTVEDKLGLDTPPEVAIPQVGSAVAATPVAATPVAGTTPAPVATTPTPIAESQPSSDLSGAANADVPKEAASESASEPEPAPTAPQEAASESASADATPEPAASEAVAAEEVVVPETRMRMPKPVSMKQSLGMLLGDELALTEREDKVDLGQGKYYRVTVLDDNDVLVGLMISDVEATIRLSSLLLMLPDGERDIQLESGDPSEDTTETMSEIFNTMSATLNNVKNNPHVRTTPLALMPTGEFQWPNTCKRRLDVDVEGGGVLIICAI